MGRLRLSLGIARAGELRATLLSRDATDAPRIALADEHGIEVPVSIEPIPTSQAFGDALARHGVRVWAIGSSATAPARAYRMVARAGSAATEIEFRTLPAAIDTELSILAATCFYSGARTADRFRAAALDPRAPAALQIFAGDNVYLDVGPGSVDADPFVEAVRRYLAHVDDDDYGAILAARPTVTTWDDHEFWNNYPEVQLHLSRSWGGSFERNRAAADEALRVFQMTRNPRPVVAGGRSFAIDLPPLSIFVADTRSRRTRTGIARPRLCPEAELGALVRWARHLRGPGLLVLGQPLWLAPGGALVDCSPANFAEDYRTILDALADAPWDVAVLSGDVHHSRAIELDVGGWSIPEIVTSAAARIPSTWEILAGGYRGQGSEDVVVPHAIEVVREGRGVPKLASYWLGGDVANTFARLRFSRSSSRGELDVGVCFVDAMTGRPAPNVAPARALPGGVRPLRAAFCDEDPLFVLRERRR